MKKLAFISFFLTIVLPLYAQIDSTYQGGAGIADVAAEDPGLFYLMLSILVFWLFVAVVVIVAIVATVFILLAVIATLVFTGILSASVLTGIRQRSFAKGAGLFVKSGMMFTGAAAGLGIGLLMAYTVWFQHQIASTVIVGMIAGILAGWIAAKLCLKMLRMIVQIIITRSKKWMQQVD